MAARAAGARRVVAGAVAAPVAPASTASSRVERRGRALDPVEGQADPGVGVGATASEAGAGGPAELPRGCHSRLAASRRIASVRGRGRSGDDAAFAGRGRAALRRRDGGRTDRVERARRHRGRRGRWACWKRASLDELGSLAAQSGWHVLLTLGFGHFEPEAAARRGGGGEGRAGGIAGSDRDRQRARLLRAGTACARSRGRRCSTTNR